MLKSISSITNAIGALNYKGTWDASTNTPTIVSSVGVKGDYYVVSVAGSTNINGLSNWGIGDWIVFNGAVWQRVEGGADLNGVNATISQNLIFTGVGARITGDFSNATDANRVSFQSSTTDGFTQISAIPNGTNPVAGFVAFNNSDLTNPSFLRMLPNATEARIQSGRLGTGTFLPMTFYTNNTKQVTIDTSGFLLRGGDSQSYGLMSSQTTAGGGHAVGAQTTGAGAALYGGWSSATNVYVVYGNGNVENTNGVYGTLSDIKLKENIADATPKLNDLMKVRVVNYNLKQELGYETQKQIGFIAQELEKVFPALVDAKADKDENGNDLGTETKSVKMTVFIPMLVKSIQEQQLQIEELKSEIAILKGA